ncbi:MAG: hypothetical protein ABI597_05030 [Gammaproteobacteria bacterium]
MRLFILSLSGKFQVIFIIGLTIILAFMMAIICGLFFDTHQLVTNTELISAVYQVMGTIYAILLTFTLWGVWQNFIEADSSVQNESYALLDLVHIIESSSTWKNSNIRAAAITYLKLVLEQEWSTLKNLTSAMINTREHGCTSAMHVINAVQTITPDTKKDDVLFGQAFTFLSRWLDARRTRILIARGDSAKALWPLLLTGSFVLFAFHGLFVAKTIGIWTTLLFGTSLVIGVTFYLIFTLDCPFEGSISIDSEPFTLAINILEQVKPDVQI